MAVNLRERSSASSQHNDHRWPPFGPAAGCKRGADRIRRRSVETDNKVIPSAQGQPLAGRALSEPRPGKGRVPKPRQRVAGWIIELGSHPAGGDRYGCGMGLPPRSHGPVRGRTPRCPGPRHAARATACGFREQCRPHPCRHPEAPGKAGPRAPGGRPPGPPSAVHDPRGLALTCNIAGSRTCQTGGRSGHSNRSRASCRACVTEARDAETCGLIKVTEAARHHGGDHVVQPAARPRDEYRRLLPHA